MAKRKTSGKRNAALPKGFAPIHRGGDSWPNDSTKTGDVLQGVITEYRTVPTKYDPKPERENVAVVERDDGSTVTLWESGGLRALFDTDYQDCEVWIRYDGLGDRVKIGRKTVQPKQYTLAVKE